MPAPRKRFGQHFLHDQTIIQRILAAIQPKPHEHLIEIGPGQGALTLPILRQIKHLEAIELDRDLIQTLTERCQNIGDLKLFNQDVLQFDFEQIKQDERLLRIFGNLPYNISTPIIFHLLHHADLIFDMVFMLQKEVAERLAAAVNTAQYGRLSVMVQYHCQVNVLFDVPPNAFYPPPKVQSSIVHLQVDRPISYPAKNKKILAEVVQAAFNQRRKTLRNSLKKWLDETNFAKAQINPQLRAENLSVKDFVDLSNTLSGT